MKERLLQVLCCPSCRNNLELGSAQLDQDEIREGELICLGCQKRYPIRCFIPRFVSDNNYARGFGFQWNRHARTQVDKFNGTRISTERFHTHTRWTPEELRGQSVLEAGCGAGRFTEAMLKAGMEVYSFDYSNAVDACLANHGLLPNFNIIQADIFRLPFAGAGFDRVFCFGVLQHTPDVKAAFFKLAEQLRPGGRIAVDVYPRTVKALLHYPRYLLRPIAKRLPAPLLYALVERAVALLLPVSILLKRIPLVGRYLYPLIPVANYWGELPLNRAMLREWSVIDTFDWLACWYDQPQTASTLRSWFTQAGLLQVNVRRLGSFVGTGTNPPATPSA